MYCCWLWLCFAASKSPNKIFISSKYNNSVNNAHFEPKTKYWPKFVESKIELTAFNLTLPANKSE